MKRCLVSIYALCTVIVCEIRCLDLPLMRLKPMATVRADTSARQPASNLGGEYGNSVPESIRSFHRPYSVTGIRSLRIPILDDSIVVRLLAPSLTSHNPLLPSLLCAIVPMREKTTGERSAPRPQ